IGGRFPRADHPITCAHQINRFSQSFIIPLREDHPSSSQTECLFRADWLGIAAPRRERDSPSTSLFGQPCICCHLAYCSSPLGRGTGAVAAKSAYPLQRAFDE